MNNRELLELAAKANGLHPCWHDNEAYLDGLFSCWNPLEDDGDALRLAVKLGIVVQSKCYDEYDKLFAAAYKYNDYGMEVASVRVPYSDDPYSATRIAIVQIAAILGKQMNEH